MSVRRSAGGEGVSPFASSFARMKRSTGFAPSRVSFTAGHGRPSHGPERPVRLAHLGDGRRAGFVAVPSGHGAPILTHAARAAICGRVEREPLLGRHLQLALAADGLEQQALLGLAEDDGRAGVAALEQGLARVEPQAAALLLRAVAGDALLDQHGADVLLEELDAGGRLVGPHGQRQRKDERQTQSNHRGSILGG